MSTRENILEVLRRENLSVNELCERVGVTRNAINVQLRQLVASGLVRAMRTPRRGRPGKPAQIYEMAPHSEDIASSAYQPLLASLLSTINARLGADALPEMLEQTGRNMARQAGLSEPNDFETGLTAALELANELGASTEVIRREDGVMVRNYSCPIGTVVRSEPCACRMLAAFFSEATGRPVTEQCQRNGRLICQYLIATADDDSES